MLECKFACCGGLEFVFDVVVVGPGGRAVPPARERDDGPAVAVEDGGEGSAKREGGVALEFLADSAYHYQSIVEINTLGKVYRFFYGKFKSAGRLSLIRQRVASLNLANKIDSHIPLIKLSMKLKTPTRPNFSRSAKLCDQTFYHDSHPVQNLHQSKLQTKPLFKRKQSTYAFSSVSRQKRGNFRFPISLPLGQFTQYPNHHLGKPSSPNWSFSKTERYNKQPLVEYELCERHPVLLEDEQLKMRASAASLCELMKDKIKTNRSSSFSLKDRSSLMSKQTRPSRSYSILQPQQTSQVDFFSRSKIEHPLYLSKQDLNQLEGQLDEKHYQQRLQPCPNGYIQFQKRRARQPNCNSKGLHTFLYANQDENQFNNYSQTKYPQGPIGHIRMDLHLDRPEYTPDRLGPNTQAYSVEATRINGSHIDLSFQKFRNTIKTRFDRVGQQPNAILDYQAKEKQLPGLIQMDRMLGRNSELFPTVDPAIKKAGDQQMKADLKRYIPLKEINEAHRPKNVEDFGKVFREGL